MLAFKVERANPAYPISYFPNLCFLNLIPEQQLAELNSEFGSSFAPQTDTNPRCHSFPSI